MSRARPGRELFEEVLVAEVELAEATLDALDAHEHRDDEVLAAEVELAEATVDALEGRVLLAAGILPGDAARGLFPHEIAARTRFALLAADLDEIAAVTTRRLEDDREGFLELLRADLHGRADLGEVRDRLMALDGPEGLMAIKGVEALVQTATQVHRGNLIDAAERARDRVRDEAADQGVELPPVPKLSKATVATLEAQALRLAQGPHVDLIRSLRERAMILAAGS